MDMMEEKDSTDELSQYSGGVRFCCEQKKLDQDSHGSTILYFFGWEGRCRLPMIDLDLETNDQFPDSMLINVEYLQEYITNFSFVSTNIFLY